MKPSPEKKIGEIERQAAFDNQLTTDDHGMHIVAKYQETNSKTPYYFVKNSWGTENPANGYLFASETYVRYKTISILVHKNGIPSNVSKKLKAL